MKLEVCQKCGKVIKVEYRHDEGTLAHVNVSMHSKNLGSGGDYVYANVDLCAECFEKSPGGKEFYAFVLETSENRPEYVRPSGQIVLKPEFTRHTGRCAVKHYHVCTCGLLEALESFPYRDTWYPPFQKEWDEHVATLTGEKKNTK